MNADNRQWRGPKDAEIERLRKRETYPCYGYDCYERGNYHVGCSACSYFKQPIPAAPDHIPAITNRIKKVGASANYWWERSPYVGNSANYCRVTGNERSQTMTDREKAIESIEAALKDVVTEVRGYSFHPVIRPALDTALAALRAEEEREKGCAYSLYNPADEGYHEGIYYRCTCGADFIDPEQAQEWQFCPYCSKVIGSKETLLCVDCENAEYEGAAGHWCAKHTCWVDDTTCFDGCKDFLARKLDGGGQE